MRTHIEFVEPRRECAKRDLVTGRACGAHVIKRVDGSWWCAICGSPRSMADTIESSLLPSYRAS